MMTHKQKKHLANKLITPEERQERVELFNSSGWNRHKKEVSDKALKNRKPKQEVVEALFLEKRKVVDEVD